MIWIAHRGNVTGRDENRENSPDYVIDAMRCGFHVEIDVRIHKNRLFLGHDNPQYEVQRSFFEAYSPFLWCHVKTLETFNYFYNKTKDLNCDPLNFFIHDKEPVVFTSLGFLWHFPSQEYVRSTEKTVLVDEGGEDFLCPDLQCYGICSDRVLYLYNQFSLISSQKRDILKK